MEIELHLTEEKWQSIEINKQEFIYKPSFYCSNFDWANEQTRVKQKLPYVHVKYYKSGISYLKASCGIVREVPIFYFVNKNKLIISDNPKYISKCKEGESMLNQECIQEFLQFGYVTSNRTLLDDTWSLRAGESIEYLGDKFNVKREYLYNQSSLFDADNEELKLELEKVSEGIFHDLIMSLNGKTAVVPLSGGYDSRFIVAMLKKGGYENVHCYAWGAGKEKEEKKISKSIANKLGFKWESIEYTEEKWTETYNSDWFDECMRYVSNYTSISGAASLPFLNTLRNNHSPNDSVLIPGHTGDFISGGHIPSALNVHSNKLDIIQQIFINHHLIKLKGKNRNEKIWNIIDREIEELSHDAKPYQIYERWEWQERQAKFIVNANRYYDYWNFKWNIPLWDARFVNFWSRVHLQEKKDKKLYNQFLEEKVFNSLDLNFKWNNNALVKPGVNNVVKILEAINLLKTIKKLMDLLYVGKRNENFNFGIIFNDLIGEEIKKNHSINLKEYKLYYNLSYYNYLLIRGDYK